MRTRILCRESDRISCVDYCAGSAHWVPLESVTVHWPSHSAWDATFHNRYIPRWVANTWNGTHWVFNLWSNEALAPGPVLLCGPTTLSAIIKWRSYNNVVETLTSLGLPDKEAFNPWQCSREADQSRYSRTAKGPGTGARLLCKC